MGLRTDIGLQATPAARGSTDTYAGQLETDVLIVGAGFGGIYLLHKLRDELGLQCKIYEAGRNLGGIWHWNCYPGARVDTQVPIYEYSIEKVWKDWTWSEKYPGWLELRKYFDHVDKVLDVKKDVAFDTRVVSSEFDKETNKWTVKTEDGRTARCKYFVIATGFAAKRHFPDWPGLDKFKGVIHHSSFWPEEGIEVKGKRVAVVGTGSTGVQIAQESGALASELTVFQRTPNLALPMRQGKLTMEEQEAKKEGYPDLFKYRLTTFAGFPYDFLKRKTLDDTPEEREAFYEGLWERGGFEFWLATYEDMLFDKKANDQAYNFWVKKTRARITDPVKREILAPETSPHAWGTKRPSLEQNYYEMFNKENVHVVDIKANPIKEVTENGIVTADGKLHEVDVIALATGFDSVTGGMKNMGLKDINGLELAEKWRLGTWSYLGMTCNGYPNMFFLYGAQGPTAFSNGPTCVEVQGDWIVDAIRMCREQHIAFIHPSKDAEESWRQNVKELSDKTLFPGTSSWYMGANVPGKPREQLNYAGGIPLYDKECRATLDGWKGFIVEKEKEGNHGPEATKKGNGTNGSAAGGSKSAHQALNEAGLGGVNGGNVSNILPQSNSPSNGSGGKAHDNMEKDAGTLENQVENKAGEKVTDVSTESKARDISPNAPKLGRRKSRLSMFFGRSEKGEKSVRDKLEEIGEMGESTHVEKPVLQRSVTEAVPKSPRANLSRRVTEEGHVKHTMNGTGLLRSKTGSTKIERRKSIWGRFGFGGKKDRKPTPRHQMASIKEQPLPEQALPQAVHEVPAKPTAKSAPPKLAMPASPSAKPEFIPLPASPFSFNLPSPTRQGPMSPLDTMVHRTMTATSSTDSTKVHTPAVEISEPKVDILKSPDVMNISLVRAREEEDIKRVEAGLVAKGLGAGGEEKMVEEWLSW